MNPGDEIEVRNGNSSKAVTVMQVARGRVVVRWPLVGEYDVDLQTGELYSPPGFARGIFSVDVRDGRVEGTQTRVVVDDLLKLDSIDVGSALALDNGQSAEVVDAVRSEGTIKIYVAGSNRSGVWRMGSLRTGYRVVPAALRVLRAGAGCIPALAS